MMPRWQNAIAAANGSWNYCPRGRRRPEPSRAELRESEWSYIDVTLKNNYKA